jgi:hypothetical protein
MGCLNDKHAGGSEGADGSLHSRAAGPQPPGQRALPTAQRAAGGWACQGFCGASKGRCCGRGAAGLPPAPDSRAGRSYYCNVPATDSCTAPKSFVGHSEKPPSKGAPGGSLHFRAHDLRRVWSGCERNLPVHRSGATAFSDQVVLSISEPAPKMFISQRSRHLPVTRLCS